MLWTFTTPVVTRFERHRVMPKKIPTQERLRASALRRLARASMSRAQLESSLRRELERFEAPAESLGWVDAILDDCERLGYLGDERFAKERWAALRRKGNSAQQIVAALRTKGVSPGLVEQLLRQEAPGAEQEAAHRLVSRRRLGRDASRRDKEMASLARAGFAYDVACRALVPATGDEEE